MREMLSELQTERPNQQAPIPPGGLAHAKPPTRARHPLPGACRDLCAGSGWWSRPRPCSAARVPRQVGALFAARGWSGGACVRLCACGCGCTPRLTPGGRARPDPLALSTNARTHERINARTHGHRRRTTRCACRHMSSHDVAAPRVADSGSWPLPRWHTAPRRAPHPHARARAGAGAGAAPSSEAADLQARHHDTAGVHATATTADAATPGDGAGAATASRAAPTRPADTVGRLRAARQIGG